MNAMYDNVDPDGLLEYSVVYTDRALNHMSSNFQQVMRDISAGLKNTYNAHCAVVVPGSGSFGMEAVARQFAIDANCLVIRNGWFSYRWSQILEMGGFAANVNVLKARQPVAGVDQPLIRLLQPLKKTNQPPSLHRTLKHRPVCCYQTTI